MVANGSTTRLDVMHEVYRGLRLVRRELTSLRTLPYRAIFITTEVKMTSTVKASEYDRVDSALLESPHPSLAPKVNPAATPRDCCDSLLPWGL